MRFLLKGKGKPAAAFIVSLVIFLIIWAFLYNSGTDVLVLNAGNNADNFVIVNRKTIFLDGRSYYLEGDSGQKFIINRTGKQLTSETFDYGDPALPTLVFDRVYLILPNSVSAEYDLPDYYPWQKPPVSVSVRKGMGHTSKTWIRYATKEEIEKYYRQEHDPLY